METTTGVPTRKRGGDKYGGLHIILLTVCTLLLTASGVVLIYGMHLLGVILLAAALLVRFLDSRL